MKVTPPIPYPCISLPTPYPVGRVNAYLVPGEPPLLVDCGVKSRRSLAELERGLAEGGVRLEEVGGILLTHPHYDHGGQAAQIARRTGVTVYTHADGVEYAFRGQELLYETLERYGAPPSLLHQLRELNRAGERYGEQMQEVPTLTLLADGDTVPGAARLTALHTPGHNAGHLCYLDRAAGVLFCGDLLLRGITPNPLPHFDPDAEHGRRSSLQLYLESLDRVEALGPLVGLAGHGGPLKDTAAAARKARSGIHRRSELVLELCAEHPDATLYELAGKLFGEELPLGQALAFTEILAHCDRLEAAGKIVVDHDGGRARVA
ncbi:MAG: MBL fold metallo-hydrolase [bacterium]